MKTTPMIRRATATATTLLALALVACGGATQQTTATPADGVPGDPAAPGAAPGMSREEIIAENFRIGVELFNAGQLPDASDAFVKVLSLDRAHAASLLYLARIAGAQGDAARAMSQVEASLANEPKDPEAIRLKVSLLRQQKRYDDALRFIDDSSARFTGAEEQEKKKGFLTDRLEILNERGDYLAVLKDGKAVLFLDPTNADAMRELGRAYLGLKRPGLARYVFKNALEIKPDARIYYFLGNLENDDGDYKLALANYQQAVDTDPTLAAAFNNLAILNQKAGNHPEAIKNLTRALELRPSWDRTRLNLANSFRHEKDYKKAEATYMEVAERNPKLPETYYNLGVLYLENEVPGYEAEDRYALAVKNFSTYRDLMGGALPTDDASAKYIKEAQTLQGQAVQMKEQMRLMQEQDSQATPPEGGEAAPADGATPAEGEQAPDGQAPVDVPSAVPEGDVPPAQAPAAEGEAATVPPQSEETTVESPDGVAPQPGTF
jgi:tetratricopeptide (TPR) repeat protein